jgi:hypothetical protein
MQTPTENFRIASIEVEMNFFREVVLENTSFVVLCSVDDAVCRFV